MDETIARELCVRNGAELLSYADASAAFLALSSGEKLIISVGTSSAKVFVERPLLGWSVPLEVASEDFSNWDDQYAQMNPLEQEALRALMPDGLLELISAFKSISDLKRSWSIIRNPIEVGAGKLLKSSGDAA